MNGRQLHPVCSPPGTWHLVGDLGSRAPLSLGPVPREPLASKVFL